MVSEKTGERAALDERSLMNGLSAGLVIAILVIFAEISFAALIFTAELASFLSQGIGILLLGSLIIGAFVTLTSSIPSAIALPQDTPAVITAVIAAAIASAMPAANSDKIFATVIAAMMLSGFLTGAFFWILGRFNLGQLVRYIPYPVIGGFLAGTGWLLIVGAIGVMINTPLSLETLTGVFIWRWLPGLLFGLVIYLMLRRFTHFLLLPALLLSGIGLFYVILFAGGGSLATAAANGWLLGPFPEGALYQPVTLFAIREADWTIVIHQAVTISTIMLVSAISLLMNASGIEITMNKDFDLNRELRSAGLGNILAAVAGCYPGYQSVSFSALGHRLGANSRVVGLTSAVLVGIALIGGAALLALFPRVIVGGFLIFIGIAFLVEWLYDSFFKLTKLEYLLIWLILIVIVTVGFLEGVAAGIIVAAILFVFNYSRVNIARHAFTGSDYQSHVMRPREEQQLLFEKGHHLYILELQGYIFFGTAHRFLQQIRERIADKERPTIQFLLLDFRLVTGIDSSATLSMQRLLQTVRGHHIQLVITHLAENIEKQWANEDSNETGAYRPQIFPDLNQGVAWCEQMILNESAAHDPPVKHNTLGEELQFILDSCGAESAADGVRQKSAADRLERYIDRIKVGQFECLVREGEQVGGLYFVEEGQVIVKAFFEDGSEMELRTMETGSVFGEISVYSHVTATADVTASQPGVLLYMSVDKLHQMEREDPQLAAAFHRLIASLMAEKMVQTNRTVRSLLS